MDDNTSFDGSSKTGMKILQTNPNLNITAMVVVVVVVKSWADEA